MGSHERKMSRMNHICQDCRSSECWKSIKISSVGEKKVLGAE